MGKVAILLSCLLLAGCGTSKVGFCAVSKAFRPTPATIAAMSEREVNEMLAHNEKGARLCGWKA
ncbi:hypothetical protein C5748_24815 [Phyllobacterium phragmitis]|uniref:Lipoprotein n=1 Tax=Phyllobacterium phragmitis TaxID=2670329 RepID=A0A2S9IK03_9HYPH|nr:hypothetical protein [Phyllobacterium phragmitis]PRD40860.1 hypothetical protein C5748_24815 [Phyllobacterium phragmitis]